MAIDRAAFAVGTVRLVSGLGFLISPVGSNRLWKGPKDLAPSTQLLLRSMGYRDALIGGLLLAASVDGRSTRGWYLASAGADAADLLGGISVHHELTLSQRTIGSAGAFVAMLAGIWGATRRGKVSVPSHH